MMDKKGQSALEYLMTYGWALVVIVIVIAALFAFGIFNPPTGGTCTGLNKLLYRDHSADATSFEIAVENGAGGTITGMSVSFTDQAGNAAYTQDGEGAGNPATMGSADTNKFTATASPGLTTGNYSVQATISYTSPAGLAKNEVATCTGLIS